MKVLLTFLWLLGSGVVLSQTTEIEQAMLYKDYEKAEFLIRKEMNGGTTSALLYQQLGIIQNGLFQYSKAVSSFERSLKKDPDNVQTMKFLADTYSSLNWSKPAVSLYQEILQKDSALLEVRSRMAGELYKLGDYSEALKQFQYLNDLDSSNYFFNKQAAKCAVKKGESKMAISYYQKVVMINPQDIQSRIHLIKLNIRLKEYFPALELCNNGLDYFPDNEKLLSEKGDILFNLKDYKKSKDIYRELYESDTTNIDCLWNLAKSAYLSDEFNEAEIYLSKLFHYRRDDYLFNWYFGMTSLQIRKYARAERFLKEAILIATPYVLPVFYYQLGQAYLYQREFAKAIESYQKALEYNPMDYDLYYHIATTYEELETNKLIAYEWYNQYLDKCNEGCNSDYVRYAIDRVGKIKEMYFFEGKQLD